VEDLVEEDTILHHKVTRSEAPKAVISEKSIVAPARFLAREIGGRAPGSPGERSASRFVERELKAMGLDPELQRFRTSITTAWSEMLVHFIVIVGVLIFPLMSGLAYALILIGFLFFLLEEFGRSPFSWLQSFAHSENVVARVAARETPQKKLVIVAHVDSPRSAFYYRPSLARFFRIFTVLDIVCMSLLFMLFTFCFGGFILKMEASSLDLLWKIGLVPLVIPFLTLVALSHKAFAGKPIPGANDNASGVGVLIELARAYSRRRPQNLEIWFVATGAADAGGTGIKRLLSKNRGQLRGAYYVILDKVGVGLPVCFRKEGVLFPFRANRKLTSVLKEIFNVHPHHSDGFKRNGLYRDEAFQLLSRGKRAITLSTREKSGCPPNWRWPEDNLDGIDPRSMRLTFDLVRAMVDNLDNEPKRK
jgi:Peptidase family M28